MPIRFLSCRLFHRQPASSVAEENEAHPPKTLNLRIKCRFGVASVHFM